jgi:hypothetical protein
MHFPCQRNGISKLYYGFRWNQNGLKESINNLKLAGIIKRDKGSKVHEIRELLSTVY